MSYRATGCGPVLKKKKEEEEEELEEEKMMMMMSLSNARPRGVT